MSEPLDLRGLKCPLPALMTRRALLRADAGAVLDVLADDPLAAIDIPHMCAQEGFAVLSVRRKSDVVYLKLQKPSAMQVAGASPPDPAGR
jgi:tRNA 2-thiouridine synthesizing protein A